MVSIRVSNFRILIERYKSLSNLISRSLNLFDFVMHVGDFPFFLVSEVDSTHKSFKS